MKISSSWNLSGTCSNATAGSKNRFLLNHSLGSRLDKAIQSCRIITDNFLLLAERSTDAQFLKPAVLALAFGVLFALFVTLLMVPSLYCVGEDLKLVGHKIKGKLKNLV